MKRLLLIPLFFLITILSLVSNFFLLNKVRSENLVIEVADGDTFQLKSGKRVRLMGVDSPEIERCAGPEAKNRLSDLILGKNVELKEEVTEAYGRSMALVYQGSILINKVMLEEGWGRPDYRKNSQRDILTVAYKIGKEKGLWTFCISSFPSLPSQPSLPISPFCNIKGNIDIATYEKFYHLPNCSHYKQTILNLAYGDQWFCTEKEAKAAGFTKSSSCFASPKP